MNECVKIDESGFYITDFCCGGEYMPPYTYSPSKCKHKFGVCDKCGTSPYNDKIHTTKNGKGLVARIKK
jgi:predicted nucleic acid-binding Zn ribbon protein